MQVFLSSISLPILFKKQCRPMQSFLPYGTCNCVLVVAIGKRVVETIWYRVYKKEQVNPLVVLVVSYVGIMWFAKCLLLSWFHSFSWWTAIIRAFAVADQGLMHSVWAYFYIISFEFGGTYHSFFFFEFLFVDVKFLGGLNVILSYGWNKCLHWSLKMC